MDLFLEGGDDGVSDIMDSFRVGGGDLDLCGDPDLLDFLGVPDVLGDLVLDLVFD